VAFEVPHLAGFALLSGVLGAPAAIDGLDISSAFDLAVATSPSHRLSVRRPSAQNYR
jgi:hypothetical protein